PLARCSGAVDGAAHRAELAACSVTQERHRRDDHDRDQRNHEGVLNCRRALLLLGAHLEVVPPGGHTRVETKDHLSPPSLRSPCEPRSRPELGGGWYPACGNSRRKLDLREFRFSLRLSTYFYVPRARLTGLADALGRRAYHAPVAVAEIEPATRAPRRR